MKKWGKNLIAGAVLLTVCAGIYVNWYYGEKQSAANLIYLNTHNFLDVRLAQGVEQDNVVYTV